MSYEGPAVPMDLTTIAERFRLAGLKATHQRMVIFKALLATKEHPSPETLFQMVHREMPSLSLGTIYKTLDAFEQAGLVSQVMTLGGVKRYDADFDRHHHLVCNLCKRIINYFEPAWDGLEPPEQLPGFTAQEVRVQVIGICDECGQKGPSLPTRDV